MGAVAERIASLAELGPAFERARHADRSAVIVIDVDANGWTEPGGAWWEVAIPEVSGRAEVRAAREAYERARGSQRLMVGRGDPR
jgi:3D-(3,5/4)-trihydroxycyclohexane-1,2-dione acylhydrolase (decyclizing)